MPILWRNEADKRNEIMVFLMSISLLLECTECHFRISRTFCALVEVYKKVRWAGPGGGAGVWVLFITSHMSDLLHIGFNKGKRNKETDCESNYRIHG